MMDDFHSGDPARVDKFVGFWFGQQTNPQSVQAFATAFIPQLQHGAPQVYQQIEKQIANSYTRSLYDEAIRTGNDGLLVLAQNMDKRLTGRWLEKGDFEARDPHAEERQRFERERAAFEEQKRTAQRQSLEQKSSALTKSMDT